MKNSDRRLAPRITISRHLDFFVLLEKDSLPVMGQVIDLSKGGIKASFQERFAEVTETFDLSIGNFKKRLELKRVRVTSLAPDGNENFTVIFQIEDPTSKAKMWSFIHDIRSSSELFNYKAFEEQAPSSRPRIPNRGHYTQEKCDERLNWLTKFSSFGYKHITDYSIDPQRLKGNIENFIGMAQVPIGISGPLLVNGKHIKGYTVAPFATTEGALVASSTRGATALSEAGGVFTRVLNQQMMRAPLFILGSMEQTFRLSAWIEEHKPEIIEQISQVSRHAELVHMDQFPMGNMLHIRFLYRTGDAAGQNMTTVCTAKACKWILAQMSLYPEIQIKSYIVEANMSGDKKVNSLNFMEGRGIRVVAESFLPEDVLNRVLKVSSKKLIETTMGFMSGSTQVGMMGFNINVANTIAAIFTATGQDIACVHESSVAQLNLTPGDDGGVYATMMMPSLIIGTVGGGTGLPTQRECLEMMGCYGRDRVFRLAEIIAGYSLALDLSTLSAIASGQFASAHERLGRNRPEDGLKQKHLNRKFFDEILRIIVGESSPRKLKLKKYDPVSLDTSNSILSDLTSNKLIKMVGHFPYQLGYIHEEEKKEVKLVIKAKPTDREIINMVNSMAQGCGNQLALNYELNKFRTGFRHCHIRELAIADLEDPRIRNHSPAVYKTWRNDEFEIFVIVMEFLDDVTHLDTIDNIGCWKDEHIKAVLKGLASIHSVYYDDLAEIEKSEWIDAPDVTKICELQELWRELSRHNIAEFPKIFTSKRKDLLKKLVEEMPNTWTELDQHPKTLCHNDFNPRNVCLRDLGDNEFRLCAYDWELATIHLPQHDLAEFLFFTLPNKSFETKLKTYVEYYREQLEFFTDLEIDPERFMTGFDYCCKDLLVNRLGLYTMAHTFKDYKFLPRIMNNIFKYLESIENE